MMILQVSDSGIGSCLSYAGAKQAPDKRGEVMTKIIAPKCPAPRRASSIAGSCPASPSTTRFMEE
jgi:hypothetical protein